MFFLLQFPNQPPAQEAIIILLDILQYKRMYCVYFYFYFAGFTTYYFLIYGAANVQIRNRDVPIETVIATVEKIVSAMGPLMEEITKQKA